MRKICVITGSRAEYGLLSGLMRAIQEDNGLQLQIIATKSLQAFEKVLQNGRFTIPKAVEDATRQYFFE